MTIQVCADLSTSPYILYVSTKAGVAKVCVIVFIARVEGKVEEKGDLWTIKEFFYNSQVKIYPIFYFNSDFKKYKTVTAFLASISGLRVR